MSNYTALLELIAANWRLLSRIPAEKINAELALRSLQNSVEPYLQGVIPHRLLTSDFMVRAVEDNPEVFKHIQPVHLDKAVAAAGMRSNPMNITLIPESLIDEELMSHVAFFDVETLRRLPERYITDFVCIQAVITDPMNLAAIPREKITYELALEAVQRNGLALEFVPAGVRDHDLLRAAIESCPLSLKHIPGPKQYPEIAELAVSLDPAVIRWVAEPLRNESLWLSAIDKDPSCLGMVSIHGQTRSMIESAISQRPEAIVYANPDYVTGRIANIVAKKAPELISHVPHELQSREFLRDYLIEDPARIGWLNNQSMLSKVDLIQWLSHTHISDPVHEVIAHRLHEFRDKMSALVQPMSDIDHLRAAMQRDVCPTLQIIHLANIKPFNYLTIGKMCVELNAEKLLKDLFGGKVYERFFKKRWSVSLDL